MTDMRKCIGSAKFGIEAHEAPAADFPVQPSQKDGLGRMCKPHWNQYTNALRKAALARKAAEGEAAEPEPVASRSEARQARTQGRHAGGRRAGRRRIARPPPVDPRAPGANPGPFCVRSRRWPRSGSSRHVGQRGRARANLGGSPISDRDNSRNPAVRTQSGGAVWVSARRHMGYPTPALVELGRRGKNCGRRHILDCDVSAHHARFLAIPHR